MAENIIIFDHVKKEYENGFVAIKDYSLEIEEGEFVVFLGPSGSGKSTSLRMLAGLEDISEGEISIRGQVVNDVASKDRGIAMVFQNYALYPHLTVEQNIGFGMKMRGASKQEVTEKVAEVAELLELGPYMDKNPGQLSGGQQQRVALGRAIVRETDIFLMDEPLSNLDARLRTTMREEIVSLHRRLDATTVYVTHDQVEAMTMADKIVVIDKGDIQQVGTPQEIYSRPANLFIADFIGNPSMNLFKLSNRDGLHYFADVPLHITSYDKEIVLGIRPENIIIDDSSEVKMHVSYIEDMGAEKFIYGTIFGQDAVVRDSSDAFYGNEDTVIGVKIQRSKSSYFDQETGQRLEGLTWE